MFHSLLIIAQVFQLKQVPIVKAAPEAISEVDAASAAGGAAKPAADKPAAAAADGEPERTEMKYVEIGSGELHVNSVQDPATGKTRARLVSEHQHEGGSECAWALSLLSSSVLLTPVLSVCPPIRVRVFLCRFFARSARSVPF